MRKHKQVQKHAAMTENMKIGPIDTVRNDLKDKSRIHQCSKNKRFLQPQFYTLNLHKQFWCHSLSHCQVNYAPIGRLLKKHIFTLRARFMLLH